MKHHTLFVLHVRTCTCMYCNGIFHVCRVMCQWLTVLVGIPRQRSTFWLVPMTGEDFCSQARLRLLEEEKLLLLFCQISSFLLPSFFCSSLSPSLLPSLFSLPSFFYSLPLFLPFPLHPTFFFFLPPSLPPSSFPLSSLLPSLPPSLPSTLRLWDVNQTDQQLHVIKGRDRQGRKSAITTCTFTRDGKMIVGALADGSIQLWKSTGPFVSWGTDKSILYMYMYM